MALAPALYHIAYHDSGLSGVSGAMTVLRTYSGNPFCTKMTLSHNQLGDDGVIALCSGILELRKRGRIIAPLKELNLSSNGITDVGLDAVIKYLLLPSAPPATQLPTLQELILSNNDISLSGATPHLLSTALSHRASSLISLSLTSNSKISRLPDNIGNLLKHLEPTSLVQLQLNTCQLEPEDARSIAKWLSDPKKGGRLAHLELNANSFGTDRFGTNRIAKLVYSGLNTSLLRLELAANERAVAVLDEDGEPTGAETSSSLPEKMVEEGLNGKDEVILGDDLPFVQIKPILADALARNHILKEATRHTAIQLLPIARVLLHARVKQMSTEEIKDQVHSVSATFKAATISSQSRNTPSTSYTYNTNKLDTSTSSPLLRLPPELLIYILRIFTTLEPIPLPPSPRHASSFNPLLPKPPIFASPLNKAQFARILALAQDRSTLSGMTQRFSHDMLGRGKMKLDSRDQGRINLHDSFSFLGVVGCLEYERRAI